MHLSAPCAHDPSYNSFITVPALGYVKLWQSLHKPLTIFRTNCCTVAECAWVVSLAAAAFILTTEHAQHGLADTS